MLLLLLPVRLRVQYDGALQVHAGLGPVCLQLYPRKKRQKEPKNAQDAGDEQEIGGIAGVWNNSDSKTVLMINCSAENTTLKSAQVGISIFAEHAADIGVAFHLADG